MPLIKSQKQNMISQYAQACTDQLALADRIIALRKQWDNGAYSGSITAGDLVGSTLEGIDPNDIGTAVANLTTTANAVTDPIRGTLEKMRLGGQR